MWVSNYLITTVLLEHIDELILEVAKQRESKITKVLMRDSRQATTGTSAKHITRDKLFSGTRPPGMSRVYGDPRTGHVMLFTGTHAPGMSSCFPEAVYPPGISRVYGDPPTGRDMLFSGTRPPVMSRVYGDPLTGRDMLFSGTHPPGVTCCFPEPTHRA